MLVLELFECAFDVLNAKVPLLFQEVILLEAGANLPFVFLVVCGDLGLALLENFDLETSFTGPLQAEVLLEFLDRFILPLLAVSDALLLVVLLLGHQPGEGGEEAFVENLNDAVFGDD